MKGYATALSEWSLTGSLSVFCGAVVGFWIGDHFERLLLPMHANLIRASAGLPRINYSARDIASIAGPLPEEWASILLLAAIYTPAHMFVLSKRSSFKYRFVVVFCMALALFAFTIVQKRVFPVAGSEFGFRGYVISLMFLLIACLARVFLAYLFSIALVALYRRMTA